MWDVKSKLTGIDNSMVVTRGKGDRELVKGEMGQIYGDGRWFDCGEYTMKYADYVS